MSSTRILIIGSDSFIARNFVKNYTGEYDIVGITRVQTGHTNEFLISDFHNIDLRYFRSCDVVINFAAIVHQPKIIDEQLYMNINYKLAVKTAHKAKEAGVKIFIQISTIAVYGNASLVSIKSPYNPGTFYAKSKLKADEELMAMQDEHFKVVIIRPPLVYGGGRAPGNMMRLIRLTDSNLPLPFKGVENKRAFIHILNLIQVIDIIIKKQMSGIFLVSDNQQVSTEFIINTISRYLNKKVKLFSVPDWMLKLIRKLRPIEYEKLFGSSIIITNFPYEELITFYPIEEGICQMVDCYKEDFSRKN